MFLFFNFLFVFQRKIFRQPSMSHDLPRGGKKKQQKTQGLYLLPRTEMLSYWPDICHSQTHTEHELPHRAHGESRRLHNEGWALQGQFCSQGFPASVQRAGVCLRCQLHWPLETLSLKNTCQLWSVAGSSEDVKTEPNIHTLAGIPAFRFLSTV